MSAAPRFARTMPVLETADMSRALEFYRDRLGFSAATWGEPANFAIVQRGTATLALNLVTGTAPAVSRKTWAAYIYVDDIDGLHAEFLRHGVHAPEPPVDRPYNCREFALDDPDGHIIAFGEVAERDALGPGLSANIGRDADTTRDAARHAGDATVWAGGCQCGAIRFRVTKLGRASFCQCRMCQKAYGGIGGALVGAKDFAWTRGEPKRFASSNKVLRGFCPDCGTPLTFETANGVDISIAAFDRGGEIAPIIQLDRAQRLPWADSLPGLPVPADTEVQRIVTWQSDIVSLQHPDHDTESWPVPPTASSR